MMLKMKKFVAVMTSVVMTAGLLSGCASAGGSGSAAAPAAEPEAVQETTEAAPAEDAEAEAVEAEAPADGEVVELTYWSWNTEDYVLPELFEKFNASQDRIHVTYNSMPSGDGDEDYIEKLQLLLSSGGDLDFFGLKNVAQYCLFADRNMLLPLSSYMDESGYDISTIGALESMVNFNDEYYGLPYSTSAWSLFYNRDIFDAEGIPYPEQLTWQEFADLAQKLTKVRDDGTKQWGTLGVAISANDTAFYAIQMGESLADDEIPHFKDGLDIMDQLFFTKQSTVSLAEMDAMGGGANMMFPNGEVAMLLAGTFLLSILDAHGENVNYDVAPMPIPDGCEPGTTMANTSLVCASSKTKHPKEVFEVMSFMASEAASEDFAAKGYFPVVFTDNAKTIFRERYPDINVDVYFNGNAYSEFPVHVRSNDLVECAKKNVQLWLYGEMTKEEALEAFEKERKEILSDSGS